MHTGVAHYLCHKCVCVCLRAVLCALAKGDVVLAERKLEQYKELDYTLSGSRECKLAEDVTAAFTEFNADEFTDVVYVSTNSLFVIGSVAVIGDGGDMLVVVMMIDYVVFFWMVITTGMPTIRFPS